MNDNKKLACPQCNAVLTRTDKFCHNCGSSISESRLTNITSRDLIHIILAFSFLALVIIIAVLINEHEQQDIREYNEMIIENSQDVYNQLDELYGGGGTGPTSKSLTE